MNAKQGYFLTNTFLILIWANIIIMFYLLDMPRSTLLLVNLITVLLWFGSEYFSTVIIEPIAERMGFHKGRLDMLELIEEKKKH